MNSHITLHLALWKKRRDIARIRDHLLWLRENQEFVRLQIPRYEADLRRLQAKLFLMEPVQRPMLLQPYGRRLPRLSDTRLLKAAWGCAQLALQAIGIAWREVTSPAPGQVPMRRSGLPRRQLDATGR